MVLPVRCKIMKPRFCRSKQLAVLCVVALVAAVSARTSTSSVDIFDPSVFNAAFYSSTNPDIDHSSVAAVQEHWQSYGVAEGRQAHGCFHTRQYLARYEDVKEACKGDTACALNHYIQHGISEGRVGYVEDGVPFGRATIADAALGICVSAGARTAGAVDSVVFQNQEMINSHDHGRQLQVAVTLCTDTTPESCRGECYNPTEVFPPFPSSCRRILLYPLPLQGGASSDDRFNPTSVLMNVSTPSNAVLSTAVLPAFWLHPGEHEPAPSAGCTVAINTVNVSNYVIGKDVSFRPFGVPNALQFSFNLYLDDSMHMLQVMRARTFCDQAVKRTVFSGETTWQVEGPTGYMLSAFTAFYTVDVKSGALTPIDNTHPGEVPVPLVFSTPDGSAAMGAMVSPATQSSFNVMYAKFNFASLQPFDNGTTKWSNVFRSGPHAKVGSRFFRSNRAAASSCSFCRELCCRIPATCVSGSYNASLLA
jgi:hypothetical protein